MERRSLFYWCKVYYRSLNEGQDYQELPNVIAVNIVGYDFPHGGGVHTRFTLREESDPSLVLSPALEIHFVNMVQWRKQREKDIASNPLHRWLTWFDEERPPELVEEVLSMDSAIMAANERQDFVIQDEAAFRTYWSRRGAEHDRISNLNGARREGEQIGRQTGREEKALEIARKMKEIGDPIEKIHDITGLDMETINGLSRT
jgi:predicted transposase/invertase (TIGR01784 family)